MHPTLIQLAKEVPVFQRIENTLRECGLEADSTTCACEHGEASFDHKITRSPFELLWSLSFDDDVDNPDDSHVLIEIDFYDELQGEDKRPRGLVIELTYTAIGGWAALRSESFDTYLTDEEKAMISPRPHGLETVEVCISHQEAFAFIRLIACILKRK